VLKLTIMTKRLGILISGGGTTMAEIIKACQSHEIPDTQVVCVISSKADAGGIDKAKNLSIPSQDIIVINPQDFKNSQNKVDQTTFGNAILQELKTREVSLVTQNGWLPLTPENVINAFPGKIFNQHPGPVPEFGGAGMYGRRVHAAVLLFNRETKRVHPYTEVIGQMVDKNFDQGKVIKSAQVEILDNDTVDDLQQRALPVEHRVQVEMLKDIVTNQIHEVHHQPLVLPEEEAILQQSKHTAILLYPKG
jgi:phosphoribosylglycinamide formyltransferase-1